jgi:hypothetical protein
MGRISSGKWYLRAGLVGLLLPLLGNRITAPDLAAATEHVAGIAVRPGTPASDLARLRRIGTNNVSLTVFWQADRPTANSVHPAANTQSDASLEHDIRNAESQGLHVALTPMVYGVGLPRGWRGALRPSDPGAFFASYTRMIDHYAALSERTGVSIFFVGSEMNSLQGLGEEWHRLIASTRRLYSGKVSYDTNWDRISPRDVAFWDAVDIVSVSAYFPLSRAARPSIRELRAAWRANEVLPGHQGWADSLALLARATGKPMLFGEAGYRSALYSTERPYDVNARLAADQSVQANAYQALFETFEPQPWWMGVMWWQWGAGTDRGDAGISPAGKQAEGVLTRWWASGGRVTHATPPPPARGARVSGQPSPFPAAPRPPLGRRALALAGLAGALAAAVAGAMGWHTAVNRRPRDGRTRARAPRRAMSIQLLGWSDAVPVRAAD